MGRSNAVKVLKRWKEKLEYGYKFDCALCGRPVEHSEQLSIDHIYPKSLGGRNHVYNYQPAHRRCNSRRGNKPIGKMSIPGGYTPTLAAPTTTKKGNTE